MEDPIDQNALGTPDTEQLLRSTKAPWQEDGLGIKGDANPTLPGSLGTRWETKPEQFVPTKNPDRFVVVPTSPDAALPSLPDEVIQSEGGTQLFPFKVSPGKDKFGNVLITVYPGVVGTTVPQMSGISLSATPKPTLYVGTFPLWLQVFTALSTNPADYRTVVDPNKPPQIFQSGAALTELTMTWTGSPADYTSGVGYFYVKIADIKVTTVNSITAAAATQYLFTNLRSIVITVNTVIILA